ncbi:MAG TPA: EAL domain-containing protein [Frankiaceae bacterium]|nr:EAL domain-containing protein [Frankiaceae bacterium]
MDEQRAPARPATAGLDRVVALARRHLGTDLAYVSAFDDGAQRFTSVAGDGTAFGIEPGGERPLAGTICARMVDDASLRVVPDVRADARLRDLPGAAGAGAYVGVPVTLPDGRRYGTFCCLSREPDPTLTERDARFLALLAELAVSEVEALERRAAAKATIRRLLDAEHVTALQPIVSLEDGRCVGVEALSRFPEPGAAPDVVFAQAHAVGLGAELERRSLASAVRLLPAVAPDQFLAVNLAPSVAATLASWPEDVPLRRLVLEITEHDAVESYAALRAALEPLRERGARIAIDDAGAGFASLHHIVELSPDIVKIDRALVHGVAHDPVRRSVVTSFVLLGVELGAVVLAEGVENEEDVGVLRRLGVRAAQGYVFAKPSTDPVDHRRWSARSLSAVG